MTTNNKALQLMLIKVAIGTLPLIAFLIFTLLVKKGLFTHFDFNTTVRIQNHIPRNFDTFFSLLSLIGSFEIVTIILFILLFVKRKFLKMIPVFALFILAHLVEIFGKAGFTHPGPPFMFFRNDISFFFPTTYIPYQAGIEGSYPSGHSLRIVYFAVIVSFFLFGQKKYSKNLKIALISLFVIFTLAMLVSRISLGEHWASDVIGGGFLGLGFGLISIIFL